MAEGIFMEQEKKENIIENDSWVIKLRRPARREGSVQYIVLVLIGFAISVSVTRLYLSLSGYPQIGHGEIHIAHVLWGGLLLFIAALLPLLMSNRRAHQAAAILTGIGIGLFIDEVGKFITQRNDYFYPVAAPIIYIFFMLILLLYVQMRRRKSLTVRSELCRALEILQDWLYHPLSRREKAILIERLDRISKREDERFLSSLAIDLTRYVQEDERPEPIEQKALWKKYIEAIEKVLTVRRLRFALAIGFLVMALIALKDPFTVLLGFHLPKFLDNFLINLHSGRWFGSVIAPTLYEVRVILEIILGSLLGLTSYFFFNNKVNLGIPFGFGILLVYLGPLDLLLFYFEQFSTIIFVIFQFVMLFCLLYFRARFIPGVQRKVSTLDV